MQDIMIMKLSIYLHFKTKTHLFFGQVYEFFWSKKFKIMEYEHDHGLLWIKNATIYGIIF